MTASIQIRTRAINDTTTRGRTAKRPQWRAVFCSSRQRAMNVALELHITQRRSVRVIDNSNNIIWQSNKMGSKRKKHIKELYSDWEAKRKTPAARSFNKRMRAAETELVKYVTHDTIAIAKAYLTGQRTRADSEEFKLSQTAYIPMIDALKEAGCDYEDIFQLLEEGQWMYLVATTILYDGHGPLCQCDDCCTKRGEKVAW